jgi:hypothetical protein
LPQPAGIQAAKLEDLERRLRADMLAEAAAWGGRVLLHREVPTPLRGTPSGPLSLKRRASLAGTGARAAAGEAGGQSGGGGPADALEAAAPGDGGGEDITRTTQDQPASTQVQAFWETPGDVGDIDAVRPPAGSTLPLLGGGGLRGVLVSDGGAGSSDSRCAMRCPANDEPAAKSAA